MEKEKTKLLTQLKKKATKAGRKILHLALTLWFCMIDKNTPLHIRALVVASLAYFVSPLDLIPDAIPGLGQLDDLAILAWTYKMVKPYIKPTHEKKADDKLDSWLGKPSRRG